MTRHKTTTRKDRSDLTSKILLLATLSIISTCNATSAREVGQHQIACKSPRTCDYARTCEVAGTHTCGDKIPTSQPNQHHNPTKHLPQHPFTRYATRTPQSLRLVIPTTQSSNETNAHQHQSSRLGNNRSTNTKSEVRDIRKRQIVIGIRGPVRVDPRTWKTKRSTRIVPAEVRCSSTISGRKLKFLPKRTNVPDNLRRNPVGTSRQINGIARAVEIDVRKSGGDIVATANELRQCNTRRSTVIRVQHPSHPLRGKSTSVTSREGGVQIGDTPPRTIGDEKIIGGSDGKIRSVRKRLRCNAQKLVLRYRKLFIKHTPSVGCQRRPGQYNDAHQFCVTTHGKSSPENTTRHATGTRINNLHQDQTAAAWLANNDTFALSGRTQADTLQRPNSTALMLANLPGQYKISIGNTSSCALSPY